jgi:glycosyltransferase involved in cell wall biosynthesis
MSGAVRCPVSVVMPVFNGARYLADAIASIRRQRHAPLEIIVVDDGSTDDSAAVAASQGPDVRVVSQANQGPGPARNRALGLARGEVVAFLDADDLWSDDKLGVQWPLLAAHPAIEVVLGPLRRTWTVPGPDGSPGAARFTEPEPALHLGCALIRRSVFDRIGLFDPAFTPTEDWDWFMRAREAGIALVAHDEVVYLYRRHGANVTNDTRHTGSMFARLLRQSLERRRRQGAGHTSLPGLVPLARFLAETAAGAGYRE